MEKSELSLLAGADAGGGGGGSWGSGHTHRTVVKFIDRCWSGRLVSWVSTLLNQRHQLINQQMVKLE